jgi:ribA/ribD-fused uncharacterized protein
MINPLMIIFTHDNQYSWLGPSSNHSVTINNTLWLTAEHYYQAERFICFPDLYQQVKDAKSTEEVYWFINEFASLTQRQWKLNRLKIMEKALRAKFDQHPSLKDELMKTEKIELVCTTYNHPYWGHDPDALELNLLGEIVMSLREEYGTKLLCAI